MKTNFDKWKEGLTAEKLLDCILDSGVSRCLPCPARDLCVHTKAGGCNSAFYRWANAPAKEEE